ncbi:MAG TPA: HAMP domain-containing sensor histidine kinase [Mycobacteriales bacterium]|nr:HAMP domain-containing sensor histidine kinase [Mycobacteriales bacterium]
MTLFVALAVGLAVALTSVAAYFTVRHELYSQLDRSLVNRAQAAIHGPLVDPLTLARFPAPLLGSADLRIALVQADASYVSAMGGVRPLLGDSELAVARGESPLSLRTESQGGMTYRVVAVPAEPGRALVFAQSTEPTADQLHGLGVILLVVGGIGIVLAASAGLSIARAGLRPVERLTAAAEGIAHTGELHPIAVRDGDDELARLARSFNAMLGALGQSQLRQRQLVADAGHELRTPLTSLRTNLDLLAQSLQSGADGLAAEERDALLSDVRAQVEEMSGLVADLVELARGDGSGGQVEQVSLTELIERALDRVRRRAPGVSFSVRIDPWEMNGDPTALERAVTNLLDNAAKWSPPGGAVTVTLDRGVLRVADQGPGIGPADLPHVFERFYRAADARSLPGSGLGLAIVRQIVERHGGVVEAGRAPSGGAMLTARFPGWAVPDIPAVASSGESFRQDSGSSQPVR